MENGVCLIKTSAKKRKEEKIVIEGKLAPLCRQMPHERLFRFISFFFWQIATLKRCRIMILTLH